jgi:hypothetical protein
MTTAMPETMPAPRADAPDDAMAKIRAAIKRAPKVPWSAEERALLAEGRRLIALGYPSISGEDFMARLATMGPEDFAPDDAFADADADAE